MSERDSWLAKTRRGEPFEQPDFDFLDHVVRARVVLDEFNRTPMNANGHRQALLASLFAKFGADVVILPGLEFDVGVNISVGDRVFFNTNCTLLDTYPITLQDDVSLGPSVMLIAADHPLKASERMWVDPVTGQHRSKTTGAPIVIEEQAWLGARVTVLPGVTIGARSTIGAGSLVTRSIPPDTLAYGNPCRPMRSLA